MWAILYNTYTYSTIGNTRVSVAYYYFYDNIQLYEFNVMKVTAMEYNLWSYQ